MVQYREAVYCATSYCHVLRMREVSESMLHHFILYLRKKDNLLHSQSVYRYSGAVHFYV